MREPERVAFGASDRALLLNLLDLPTAGPLETDGGQPIELWAAMDRYAAAAHELGCETVLCQAPGPATVLGDHVPLAVREAARHSPDFLACQPSMVLRLGPALPRERTVMFNVHLDTVAGVPEARFAEGRFHGRGAIDAKGPAVALLAGVRAALELVPGLGRDVGVLIQAVSGEEGGAMGVLGTRPLVEQGHLGRINIFCEPTGRRLLTRCTAAMTARVSVDGDGAIDDDPGAGHNATVLLGYLAQHLAATLPRYAVDGQVCVAGIHTGRMHNKVYGTGELLLNLSYGSAASGAALEAATERAVREGLAEFGRRFAGTRGFARTAGQAASITRLEWLKRGLPTLDSADPWATDLLRAGAGLASWPAGEPAFTCDAIWAAGVAGTFTAVYGPGDLGRNRAHAQGEYADQVELERYAGDIARLLAAFAAATQNTVAAGTATQNTTTGTGGPRIS